MTTFIQESASKAGNTAMLRFSAIFPNLAFKIADRRLSRRMYNRTTESLFKIAAVRMRTARVYFRYADYLTQAFGYQHPSLNGLLIAITQNLNLRKLSRSQKSRLLTIAYAQNNGEIVNILLRDMNLQEVSVLPNSMYLESRFGEYYFFRNQPVFLRAFSMLSAIEDARQRLEEIFCSAKGNICIVGNGPSNLGQNLGNFVDSHRYVVRFNEFSLEFEKDYGIKTDIIVCNKKLIRNFAMSKLTKPDVFRVICSNNYTFKQDDYAKEILPLWAGDRLYTVIPPEIFQELIARLGCLPSSGLAFLYWLYKVSGSVSREKILGFSHLSGSKYTDHYFENQNRRPLKTDIHSWDSESSLFQEITNA